MVVLAACICTHGGKALLSRSFRNLDRDRITALLANFPGLLSQSESQNTTVEDESVRYVYQPLEEFYVVMLTNKQSNILQDIDTLHLFVSVVSNIVRVVDEKELLDNAFEILSAFDEIATLGYKEKLTLSQVQTYLEMDSHEEKIQEIIERNKELEAIEERRRRAKEIQRKELARKNMEQQQSAMFGSQGSAAAAANNITYGYQANNTPSYDTAPQVERVAAPTHSSDLLSKKLGAPGGAGLQLGKKSGKVAKHDSHSQPLLTTKTPFAGSAASQAQAPAKSAPREFAQSPAVSRGAAAASPAIPSEQVSATASPVPQGTSKAYNDGILITLSEKVTADISREGSVITAEVKGDLQLRINDPSLAKVKILLKTGSAQAVQYKTHPNVDKALFTSQSVIGLKDKNKSFPSNDQSLGVLRWKVVDTAGDRLVPLLVTAWVGFNDGVADVTLEYEIPQSYIDSHPTQESIDNVTILVPIASDEVQLKDESGASVSYENTDSGVLFELESISLSEPSGAFEFSIPADDEDSLFPISVSVDVHRTEGVTESDVAFGQVQVLDVVTVDEDEASLPFTLHHNVVTESYTVQ